MHLAVQIPADCLPVEGLELPLKPAIPCNPTPVEAGHVHNAVFRKDVVPLE
jgi:hypothetical protein